MKLLEARQLGLTAADFNAVPAQFWSSAQGRIQAVAEAADRHVERPVPYHLQKTEIIKAKM
jgi:hypothetical protein